MLAMPKSSYCVISSPFGKITLLTVADETATVIGCGFGPTDTLIGRVLATRELAEVKPGKAPKDISSLLEQWIAGDFAALNKIPVEQVGTKFRQECWAAMRKIKPGRPISYADLADRTSSKSAVRAAATACASNLIAPIVPCHRIIKSDGTIGGYGYGVALKEQLLAHENVSS